MKTNEAKQICTLCGKHPSVLDGESLGRRDSHLCIYCYVAQYAPRLTVPVREHLAAGATDGIILDIIADHQQAPGLRMALEPPYPYTTGSVLLTHEPHI